MIDNDGNITAGGWVGIIAIVIAPVLLGIALFKLFFRAPLAAILGAAFCTALAMIAVVIASSFMTGLNPLQGLLLGAFFLCLGAGACYGLMSMGWMQNFFKWECSVLNLALSHGGLAGRAFYVFVQIIPGILFVFFSGLLLISGRLLSSQGDLMIGLVILAWLAVSQFVIYRFHRTDHPIGQQVDFTGLPLERALVATQSAE